MGAPWPDAVSKDFLKELGFSSVLTYHVICIFVFLPFQCFPRSGCYFIGINSLQPQFLSFLPFVIKSEGGRENIKESHQVQTCIFFLKAVNDCLLLQNMLGSRNGISNSYFFPLTSRRR